MRIAICDDLQTERQKTIEALDSVIRNFSVNEFDDGAELIKSHEVLPYDLIILDILMPKISGMDTAAQIRKNDTKTPIVFISTSEEFGVQSYRVLAFDYLLKPIDTEQLRACMRRLLSQRTKKHYITVTYSGTETKILLSNIQCLESNLRKVIFTLSENREIEVVGKLTDYEEFLLHHGFCRCHKSYLVNMEYIDSIDNDVFYLTSGKTMKISRTYLQSAKRHILTMYLRRRERHEPFRKYRIAVCDTFYMYSGRLFHDELPCAGKTCLWVFCCRNSSLSGIQFLYHDSLWKYGASKCYFIHNRTAVFCVDIVDHQR